MNLNALNDYITCGGWLLLVVPGGPSEVPDSIAALVLESVMGLVVRGRIYLKINMILLT